MFGTKWHARSVAGLLTLAIFAGPSVVRADELLEEARSYFEPAP